MGEAHLPRTPYLKITLASRSRTCWFTPREGAFSGAVRSAPVGARFAPETPDYFDSRFFLLLCLGTAGAHRAFSVGCSRRGAWPTGAAVGGCSPTPFRPAKAVLPAGLRPPPPSCRRAPGFGQSGRGLRPFVFFRLSRQPPRRATFLTKSKASPLSWTTRFRFRKKKPHDANVCYRRQNVRGLSVPPNPP